MSRTRYKNREDLDRLASVARNINSMAYKGKLDDSVLSRICTEILKIKPYKLVWIGLVDDSINLEKINIKPIALKNLDQDSRLLIELLISKEELNGEPLMNVLRLKKPKVIKFGYPGEPDSHLHKIIYRKDFQSLLIIPLHYNGRVLGSLNIFSEMQDSFQNDEIKILQKTADNLIGSVNTVKLKLELKGTLKQLQRVLYETIDAITLMSEIKDPYTSGHQKRVALIASAIANELELPRDMIDGIYISGLLHDIGKISVPNDILSKPGKLNEGEFLIVKNHPIVSYDILKNIEFPWPIARIVKNHHERIDGSGYPDGLKDKDISICSKILAVADVVEAMTSHRPYRPALGMRKALKEIEENRNKLYDQKVVNACIKVLMEKKV
ncbi:MAG: HD domain-containing protein [Actinobacteria bacterium]|nr:HD domain-containing protein [Actinomycetota bacterium]